MEVYCKRSVTKYYSAFRFLFPTILEWNKSRKSFYSRGYINPKRYWPWFFIVYGIALGTGANSCIFTIYYGKNFDVVNVMFTTIFLMICLPLFGCVTVMILHVHEIVLAFEGMDKLISAIGPSYKEGADGKRDTFRNISRLLNQVVYQVLAMSLLLPTAGVVANIDPYINVYTYFFRDQFCGNSDTTSCETADMIAFIVRLLLSSLDVVEAYRSTLAIMTTLFLWLEMQTKYFENLKRIPNKQFICDYNSYTIVLQIWKDCLFEWLRLLMGLFFFVIVACNVGTVKFGLTGKIPAYIIWFTPAMSVLYSSVVYVLFPFIMGCHEDSERLLNERYKALALRNEKVSQRERKIQQKQLRSLKPISFKCGGSFVLKKETKSTFYDAVVNRTVDGILV